MKKTKIVKEVIGEKLKEYGFTHYKSETKAWIFKRTVKEWKGFYDPDNDRVTQYIMIQESRFDTIVIVRFYTDAYGQEIGQEVIQARDKEKYVLSENGWFRYTDEVTFKETLLILWDIIETYGFNLLKKLSVEEEVIPTKEMAQELYTNHKSLDLAFQKEFAMNRVVKKREDIDEWFTKIQEIIHNTQGMDYNQVKRTLLGMAAFLGERACEILDEEWVFPDYHKAPFTVNKQHKYPAFHALVAVVLWWKNDVGLKEYIMEEYQKAFINGIGSIE